MPLEPANAYLQYFGGFLEDNCNDIYTTWYYSKINNELCFYTLGLIFWWRLNIWNCLSVAL